MDFSSMLIVQEKNLSVQYTPRMLQFKIQIKKRLVEEPEFPLQQTSSRERQLSSSK